MKEISFRIATEKDGDFIGHLSAEAFSVFGEYGEILTEWFAGPGVITVISSRNGQRVGFAMLQPGEKETWNASTGELLAIAVIPECHRQGMGRALLRHMGNLASQFRLREIRLHTAEGNLPARYLFETEGYKIVGLERNYYPRGQSAVVMVKKLDQNR